VFCGIIHRLIVADVTHTDSEQWYWLLMAPLLMLCGSVAQMMMGGEWMSSAVVVYGLLLYVLAFWAYYALSVVREICETLHIRLFVITEPKKQ